MTVFLPMIFIMVEILSLLFGHSFASITFLGIQFHFIIGVIFFCLGFYILDIVTEVYDNKFADRIIYGKILCQIMFVFFVHIGVRMNTDATQMTLLHTMDFMPRMIISGIIASMIGYKLTTHIMQYLKIRYEGKFTMLRYLVSTLPGEFAFSFIYSFIFLYNEYPFEEFIKIFYSLAAAKLIFSISFSTIFRPATKIIAFMINKSSKKNFEYARIK